MRKLLSLTLSAIIILTLALPISAAPEGTAVASAEDFMKMTPDGKYYLAADITLAATYESTFLGSLDGNGKTVTVNAPIFSDFSGEVRNLIIAGEINMQDKDAAAFAVTSTRGFSAYDCINNAAVTVSGKATCAAGFVASCDGKVIFERCVNNGNIHFDSSIGENPRVGGFGAFIDTVHLTDCVNDGDVYLKGNSANAGGFVGCAALYADGNSAEAYACVNNGNVTVEDTYIDKDGNPGKGSSQAGGIFGNVGTSKNEGVYRIWGCVNNGNVDAPFRAGGLAGYVYGSKEKAYVDIQFCINTGDVIYGRTKNIGEEFYDYASAFVSYTNSTFTTVKYSIDTGNVIRREGCLSIPNDGNVFIGASSADITMYDITGIFMLNKEKYTYLSYSNGFSAVVNTHFFETFEGVVDIAQENLESGKVAYEINKLAAEDLHSAAKEYSFYQKLGTDKLPTIDPEHGWILLSGNTYVNGEKVNTTEASVTTEPEQTEPETTAAPEPTEPEATFIPEAPVQTTSPTVEEEKGCGGYLAGCAVMVSIIGTAFVIRKKE